MNNKTENLYCDRIGKIFNFLNNSLQDYLYTSHYNLNYPFCILKITELCDEFLQNIIL